MKKEINILTDKVFVNKIIDHIESEMKTVLIPKKGFYAKSEMFVHYYPDRNAGTVDIMNLQTNTLYHVYWKPEGNDMVTLDMCINDSRRIGNTKRNCLVNDRIYYSVASNTTGFPDFTRKGKFTWICLDEEDYEKSLTYLTGLDLADKPSDKDNSDSIINAKESITNAGNALKNIIKSRF